MISRLDIPLVDDFAFCPLARTNIPVEHFRLCGSFIPKSAECCLDFYSSRNDWEDVVHNCMDRTSILSSFIRRNTRFYKVVDRRIGHTKIASEINFYQNAIKPHVSHWKYEAGVVQ